MNWQKLFDAQRGMQETVEKNHPRQEGEDRFTKTINAFLVEMAETAQEQRFFKYWSIKPPSEKKIVLEELSDALHFMLIIGIELEIDKIDTITVTVAEEQAEINKVFKDVMWSASTLGYSSLVDKGMYQTLVANFILFMRKLDFTFEDMEAAYFKKHEINHARQESGVY